MTVDPRLSLLTLEEKVALLSGRGRWENHGVERLGIRPLKMVDGPNGARGDSREEIPAVVTPAPVSIGASWDVDLARRLGALVGRETRRRKAQILLAPTINIQRTPIGGRNFECFSEDPELVSRMAVAYIRGVQSEGVAATAKHFVGNDTEVDRHRIDCRIDEQTLREVYLRPFEAAVTEAGVLAVMSAYNRLNGVHCTEHEWLLRTVLRDEWGFDGVVVSDWHAVISTEPTVTAGTTLEMPGPVVHYGRRLVDAVRGGALEESTVDGLAVEVLRVGAAVRWPDVGDADEDTVDDPHERALCREAAAAGTVLLHNDGLLPLDLDAITLLAVVGPLADRSQIQGGGSAKLVPLPAVTPLEAVRERLGEAIEVVHAFGVDIDKRAPIIASGLSRANGAPGMDLELFRGRDGTGAVEATQQRRTSEISWRAGVPAEVDENGWSAHISGRFTAAVSGLHRFSLLTTGSATLHADGVDLIGPLTESDTRSDAYYSLAGPEVWGELDLHEGQAVDLRIHYSTASSPFPAVRLGCRPPESGDPFGDAVAAAAAAHVAVMVVGTTDEWETEGNDRDSLALPAGQDDLIAAIAAANPNTVVVLDVGAPVTMPWLDDVAAVVLPWFAGIEASPALVDVLLGHAEPGGRLPITFPKQLADHPAAAHYPGVDHTMTYGEGALVGHRGYEAADVEVLFPFGHGLSYTTFDYGDLAMEGSTTTGDLTAKVLVTNRGDRAGSTVVQVYAQRRGQPSPVLAGFAKVKLASSESTVVVVPIHARTLAEWTDDHWAQPSGPITWEIR